MKRKNYIYLALLIPMVLVSCGKGTVEGIQPSKGTPTDQPVISGVPSDAMGESAEKEETTGTKTPAEKDSKVIHAELLPIEEGKDVLLDLDGDGTIEQLRISMEGVFINGELKLKPWNYTLFKPWEWVWLVDIDTSDSYLNLIFKWGNEEGEDMAWWYQGELRTESMSVISHSPFSTAQYHGDGTFVVADCGVPLLYQSCYKDVEFVWDAEGGMTRVDKQQAVISEEYEEIDSEDGQWRLLKNLYLYEDCALDAPTIQVQAGQRICPMSISYTENEDSIICWINIQTEKGEQGWIHTQMMDGDNVWMINQEYDAREVITGYSTAG